MKKRMVFEFCARVVRDVELPDGCDEGDDAYEQAIDNAAQLIDVDRYAECTEVKDAREGEALT